MSFNWVNTKGVYSIPIAKQIEVLKVVIILEFYGDIFSYFKYAILLSNKYFVIFSEIFFGKINAQRSNISIGEGKFLQPIC
jgi:hypothetical protein